MGKIHVLSSEVSNKIAAGEVVERPSSVIKELVENSIDAGATLISVEIKKGGSIYMRVSDNGSGMSEEDAKICFLRHATSKVQTSSDLDAIYTLGFRGEALSSIAAVAQVELITKTYEELTGTRYVIEGSKEVENEEIGAPEGTTFIVRNLFYNVPARRKFLKTAQTEAGYISDLMERMALSHPDVSFKFINNGQTKLHTSGNGNEKDLIYHIYGRDITAAVLKVEHETELFKLRGFIGKPIISRGNRNYENYFINGRYIKSALIAKSIEEAYKAAETPIRDFMYGQTQEKDLHLFMDIDGEDYPDQMTLELYYDVPMTTVIPAFIISELRYAFIMGFLIYIPFIVIDMVVASVLMSMGMMMLPPTTISLPFKILLFILADGWNLVIGSVVKTFY